MLRLSRRSVSLLMPAVACQTNCPDTKEKEMRGKWYIKKITRACVWEATGQAGRIKYIVFIYFTSKYNSTSRASRSWAAILNSYQLQKYLECRIFDHTRVSLRTPTMTPDFAITLFLFQKWKRKCPFLFDSSLRLSRAASRVLPSFKFYFPALDNESC